MYTIKPLNQNCKLLWDTKLHPLFQQRKVDACRSTGQSDTKIQVGALRPWFYFCFRF